MRKQILRKLAKIQLLSGDDGNRDKILDILEDCIELTGEFLDDEEDEEIADLIDQVADTLEAMQDDLMVPGRDVSDIDMWNENLEDIIDILENLDEDME